MSVSVFEDKESEYMTWLRNNPTGYVLTTVRSISLTYMSLHRASCRMISHYMSNMASDAFTGRNYIKICSTSPSQLSAWIKKKGGSGFTRLCSKCNPEVSEPIIDGAQKVENKFKQQIDFDEFVDFVKTLQGRMIFTRKQKKGFAVNVTDKGFEFTPAETNTRRPHEQQAIKRVINRFNESRSFITSDYRDITYNASYTLTLLDLYLDFSPTADSEELEEKVHRIRKTMSATDCPEGQVQPLRVKTSISSYLRDPLVKAWILENAKGHCESCGEAAPFLNSYGEPFLEVHHVIQLSDGGSDTVCNTIAVCPNCHRRHHYSENKESDLKTLYKKVQRLKRPFQDRKGSEE